MDKDIIRPGMILAAKGNRDFFAGLQNRYRDQLAFVAAAKHGQSYGWATRPYFGWGAENRETRAELLRVSSVRWRHDQAEWGRKNRKATVLWFDRADGWWHRWLYQVDLALDARSATLARILSEDGAPVPGEALQIIGDRVERVRL